MKNKILLILFSLLALSSTQAADMQKLVQDTQRMTQEGSKMNLIWWIPSQFWEVALSEDPNLTDNQKKEFVALLDDYSAFVVVKMNTAGLAGMTFENRESILKNVTLKVDGKEIAPIPNDELNPQAQGFYAMMKPMMGQMLGQFGKGMEFIIYPNKKDGKYILNPKEEGSFTYTCFEQNHEWRLPLGSLLPPVWDSNTKETFPGNYKFNPFTGSKLTPKETP
ncbi:MAG: hypothetical protein ACSHX6_02655 [Akkermansiaceae bacterium]